MDAAPPRRLADRVDRLVVLGVIPLGVTGGHRRLTQHVVGIAEAARLLLAAVRQRLGYRLPADELLAQHPHGDIYACADQRLAAAADQARERRRKPRLAR